MIQKQATNLSVIIITKDCAATIESCLKSVQPLSGEIIILDSGSSDNTVEICRIYTQHVYITDWPGFGLQKQRALDKATNEWVLSIDADEVLTASCQKAILQAIKQSLYNGYRINRLMVFAGEIIRHSGCSDKPLRLFKRISGKFTHDIVHESIIVNGKISGISEPMLHYSYANIGEWIAKMNLYSELGAHKKNKDSSVSKAIFAAIVSFVKMYFLKKGFLDGRLGLVAAINSSVASYYKYLKLALDKHFTLP